MASLLCEHPSDLAGLSNLVHILIARKQMPIYITFSPLHIQYTLPTIYKITKHTAIHTQVCLYTRVYHTYNTFKRHLPHPLLWRPHDHLAMVTPQTQGCVATLETHLGLATMFIPCLEPFTLTNKFSSYFALLDSYRYWARVYSLDVTFYRIFHWRKELLFYF